MCHDLLNIQIGRTKSLERTRAGRVSWECGSDGPPGVFKITRITPRPIPSPTFGLRRKMAVRCLHLRLHTGGNGEMVRSNEMIEARPNVSPSQELPRSQQQVGTPCDYGFALTNAAFAGNVFKD